MFLVEMNPNTTLWEGSSTKQMGKITSWIQKKHKAGNKKQEAAD